MTTAQPEVSTPANGVDAPADARPQPAGWRAAARRVLFGADDESAPIPLDTTQLAQLRQLRADVQDMQNLLATIRNGDASLDAYAPHLREAVRQIAAFQTVLAGMQTADTADRIQHILNLIEQIKVCQFFQPPAAPPSAPIDAQAQLHLLNVLNQQCDRLVFHIGVLTIPSRVNSWLRNARPGYYIPFHLVFDTELPSQEDRMRLLNYMAWQPKTLAGGLVNPATGLIYKYALSHEWKAISFLMLVAAVEWTIIGLLTMPHYLAAAGVAVPHGQQPVTFAYLVIWAAVLAGVVLHIVVATAKRLRGQPDSPPIFALGTLFPLLNAYIGLNLFKLLLTLIGFIGVIVVYGGDPDLVTPLNALLVGYSLDSVVELFGASVERKAAGQVAAIQKQLGVAAEK